MLPSQQQALRILKSWHTIEFFQPYDLEYSSHQRHKIKLSHQELSQQGDHLLPWLSQTARHQLKMQAHRRYHYIIYLGIFDKSTLIELSKGIFGDPANDHLAFTEQQQLQGDTCFAKLYLNEWGHPDFLRMSVSTMPWSIGRLLTQRDGELSLAAYDKSCQWLTEVIHRINQNLPMHPDNKQSPTLNASWLQQLVIELYQFANFTPNSQFACRIDCFEIKSKPNKSLPIKTKTSSPQQQDDEEQIVYEISTPLDKSVRILPILNSFYLNDLEQIINDLSAPMQPTTTQHGIMQYLSIKQHKHPDLYTQQGLTMIIERLSPKNIPEGRWPAEPSQQMNLMQQFAVNTIFKRLKKQGILSINGPPGTGKTTLLREVIANNIVERAKVLSQLASAEQGIDSQGFLHPDLCGFEMIVASTNNLAVENISKELPRLTAIGKHFADLEHLKPVANQLNGQKTREGYQALRTDEQCWGIICGILGRANNRYRFADSLFFDEHFRRDTPAERQRPPEYDYLSLWRYLKLHQISDFTTAKQNFLTKLTKFKQQQQKLQQIAELNEWLNHHQPSTDPEYLSKLQHFEQLATQFADINLPNGHQQVHQQQTQLSSYYLNEPLNQLRSEIFISALGLHLSWFNSIIKHQQVIDHIFDLQKVIKGLPCQQPLQLWQLFFMLIPVVSTTFASMANMFAPIKTQAFGWLMIDEAGQAVPQAAVGGIWRAKRTIVLGDPQQIEPVFTTPSQLTKHLCKDILDQDQLDWDPQHKSVQQIADRANPYGCLLEVMGKPQWIGIPLWVHRRCIEPMFSLANTIAYNNRMIHGLSQAQIQPQIHAKAGLSYWQASTGSTIDRQYQANLAIDTLKLLNSLIINPMDLHEIYIITPFRAIKSNLIRALDLHWQHFKCSKEQYRYWRKNNLGTIHTFQGKENTVVILVLGCDQHNIGAARWAARKPNLLNVALTRAQKHIYIVGDPEVWRAQPYFCQLENWLTVRH